MRRGACDWTVVAQGGEIFWFHSVTVGGSVLCLRNKLHIIWKGVISFGEAEWRGGGALLAWPTTVGSPEITI